MKSSVCRPSIQASKRRQALMATSAQNQANLAFNPSFSPQSGVISLDSGEEVWENDNTNNDIGVSSIDIGGEG
jgi:hypothetical protein